ncbi:hypothetical protein LOC72_20210 [Roseiconus lacunae]|nr:hypothetical protein [Roseiconus lacunae]
MGSNESNDRRCDGLTSHSPRHPNGVVLLIVLGMLSLFTVLIVSFVVFSSQVAESSAASQERRLSEILPDPPIENAVNQLILGTDDSKSAAFGASLMEDFYGSDGRLMRVAHRRRNSAGIPAPYNNKVVPRESGGQYKVARGQLLLPLNAASEPQTTLFKFPTNMAYWHFDGQPDNAPSNAPPPWMGTAFEEHIDLYPHLDDSLAGRVLTFDEGPLKNYSFRVIRSFGRENGTSDSGSSAAGVTNLAEYALGGNVVIDLAEMGTEEIEINGVIERLYDVAAASPNLLLYSPGDDDAPGVAGVDDDGINGVDDAGELGYPLSDDVGYPFVLNGGVFNGRGLNPEGVTGVDRRGTSLDGNAEIEFTLNSRLTGFSYQGGSLAPEMDEAWDAADWENMFLAWQPSDHRRPIRNTGNNIYSSLDGDRLNRQLGQHIIPSFHRPAVINYLMNAPIWLPGETRDPTDGAYVEERFANIRQRAISGSPQANDGVRLVHLINRIRRATLRPLNFSHEYAGTILGPVQGVDLNGDGVPFDGTPGFTGSNAVPILNQTIDVSAVSSNLLQVVNNVEALATWLVNGPWDVDNDGDGLPDSVWVDFNLPSIPGPDGRLLKPMTAFLVEDLDGKINVNYAGSYNQIYQERFHTPSVSGGSDSRQSVYENATEYDEVKLALDVFGHGGGVGPAEIDFSHLFTPDAPYNPSFYLGPLSTTQTTSGTLRLDNLLFTRYGNLMNARYGGTIFDYARSYPYPTPTFQIPTSTAAFPQSIYPYAITSEADRRYSAVGSQPARAENARFLKYPGVGNRYYPSEEADKLARIPFPSRLYDHAATAVAGRPVDLSGTEIVYKDPNGSHRFNRPYSGADIANHPYEFGATEIRGDDQPFSPAEYVDFLKGGPLGGRLAQLLSDAADRNEALDRLITTESRSVDSPEVPGLPSLLHLIAERFERHATATGGTEPDDRVQATLLNRMLAVELRKGSKLNLNRQIGNNRTETVATNHVPNIVVAGLYDESAETSSQLQMDGSGGWEAKTANNRLAPEAAFPQLDVDTNANLTTGTISVGSQGNLTAQATANAHYGPTNLHPITTNVNAASPILNNAPYTNTGLRTYDNIADFDGVDLDGDGFMTPWNPRNSPWDPSAPPTGNPAPDAGLSPGNAEGTDVNGDGEADAVATGSELLARHLYCLMYALLAADIDSSGELVPNYPYPGQLGTAPVEVKNRYVARQLAQWAVNAVDYRDVDTKFTRLRYDWNPFDQNGFNLAIAANNEVWGVERPEAQLSEAFAMHDKRLKRNLPELLDTTTAPPTSEDGDGNAANNELPSDDEATDTSSYPADSDMDQFRMPQGSAFVEIQALAPPVSGSGGAQPSLPGELYSSNRLDLGRIVGTGNNQSPVWRLAVGENHGGDRFKSSRWMFDADRLEELHASGEGSGAYLGMNLDWNTAADVTTAREEWQGSTWASPPTVPTWYSADIRNSRRIMADPLRTEHVTLGDTDFNPTNEASNPTRLRLTRFVWFAALSPSANPNLRLLTDARSGMRHNNVFFQRRQPIHNPPGSATGNPENSGLLLRPGQYAVVAPRSRTYFGQRKKPTNNDADPQPAATDFTYDPSYQKIDFGLVGASSLFGVEYYGSANNTDLLAPIYSDGTGANSHVGDVLPIICESVYPDELPASYYTPATTPLRTAWADYQTNVRGPDPDLRVDMGFNISAPLPGPNFYPAPTHQVNPDPDPVSNEVYPVDSYSDAYHNPPPATPASFFPDTPFDHIAGRPLEDNSYTFDLPSGEVNVQWNAIGTHQEAATVFLQRLADPTTPWHPTNNPYITVDFLPMDLTTFNGEQDVRENVDRKIGLDGMGNPDTRVELIDNRSTWDRTTYIGNPNVNNGFVPELQLDTRRKMPDLIKDRGMSQIVDVGVIGTPADSREVIAHRSKLTMTTNDLRPSVPTRMTPPVGAAADYMPFELGAMWTNGTEDTPGVPDTRYRDRTGNVLAFDNDALNFRQTIGFINREYGAPVQSNFQRASVFEADFVYFNTIPWMNREYRSPMDLLNVPAVSRTRLLATFGPQTELQDNARREITTDALESIEAIAGSPTVRDTHLLGFVTGNGSIRTDDDQTDAFGTAQTRPDVGIAIDDDADFEDLTGGRAGFEQIFDYVDVGPVWFDSQRWLDPEKVEFRQDRNLAAQNTLLGQRQRMFNRSVETLQPPNNYIGLHRTPGKINLNTTPDYIRKGPNFASSATAAVRSQQFLDGVDDPADTSANPRQVLEDPTNPQALASNVQQLLWNPHNLSVRGDGLSPQYVASQLFGNGSVYRSLAWGHSGFYELDDTRGSPSVLGQNNRYFESTDTYFGRGFKGYIESRRGYSTTRPYPASVPVPTISVPNPELDYAYPTRFAGVFAPAQASATPSVQRFMRQLGRDTAATAGYPRRTHDMGLLRPHPDFDLRTLTSDQITDIQNATDTRFSLEVEENTTMLTINNPSNTNQLPLLTNGNETETRPAGGPTFPAALQPITDLRMPIVNTGLFERPQAELHMNRRAKDRDSYFRHQHAARMAGMTTHHSNVFLVRMTVGYFVVDPQTGAPTQEYVTDTGEPKRTKATYVIDRTVPIGFLRGKNMNAAKTILYSEIEE